MIQPSDKRDAISITIASGIVLFGSVMPWAQLSGSPFDGLPFPGMNMSIRMTMTAWNGNLRLLGIQVPNSTVVLVALIVSVVAWLQVSQVWSAPRALCLSLVGYAAMHTIWFIFVVLGSGSLGIGSVLTAAAFAWMFVVLIRQVRQPATPPSVQSPENGLASYSARGPD